MHPHVTLLTLGVDDLSRSVRFYAEGLGWRIKNDWKEQGVAFLPLASGLVLALWPEKELAKDAGIPAARFGFRGAALAHNVASRSDVDAALAVAERAGARIVKPAHETFWGGYSGYFEDPDGHLWEVAHNPFWTLDARGVATLP